MVTSADEAKPNGLKKPVKIPKNASRRLYRLSV